MKLPPDEALTDGCQYAGDLLNAILIRESPNTSYLWPRNHGYSVPTQKKPEGMPRVPRSEDKMRQFAPVWILQVHEHRLFLRRYGERLFLVGLIGRAPGRYQY
jgi:hypothetical protein